MAPVIDFDQIVGLATPIGTAGTIQAGEVVPDNLFEYLVGIAIMIYESNPG